MNPCDRPNCCGNDCGSESEDNCKVPAPAQQAATHKRQIAVAVVKASNGLNQRIELISVADLIHLFALSMGYRPDIAFAFGVISRSTPEVQAGECDVDVELAHKSIRIAALINQCRETNSMPDDIQQVEAILAATAHIHTIEQAYAELCQRVPNIDQTFMEQYNDWFRGQERREQAKKIGGSLIGHFIKWVTSGSMARSTQD